MQTVHPSYSTLEQLWARQQIGACDVDYSLLQRYRDLLHTQSKATRSCTFMVDVYKCWYDFASPGFADIFGFNPLWINTIQQQGDYLEDRRHPDDHGQILDMQIKLSHFIYSLPPEQRNDYRNIYQFRMLGARGRYINVTSSQQVLLKDKNGKAWIVMGTLEVSPCQRPMDNIQCSVLNIKTGEVMDAAMLVSPGSVLTDRELEVLSLIRQGLLSKEIAARLEISIYTVNNHRKNILAKLDADNAIEAINAATRRGILL